MRSRELARWMVFVPAVAAGCNGILGIEDVTLDPGDAGITDASAEASDAVASSDSGDGGADATAILALAAGGQTTCALVTGGRVFCWGINTEGEVGNGDDSGANVLTPTALAGSYVATRISVGFGHSCLVDTGGLVACWGSNSTGQLGNGTFGSNVFTPAKVKSADGGPFLASEITTGYDFSCAIHADTKLGVCWGANFNAQLGIGSVTPAQLTGPKYDFILPGPGGSTPIEAIAAGWSHACARNGGLLYCWGENNNGQTGQTPSPQVLSPAIVSSIVDAGALSAAHNFTCVIGVGPGAPTTPGVYCWGLNDVKQLGTSGDGATSVPTPQLVGAVVSPAAVTVGAAHACAIDSAGLVTCWGQNGLDELGRDGGATSNAPGLVDGITNATLIAAGNDHTCVATRDQKIFCWGSNASGQLGTGDDSGLSSATPREVIGF